MLRTLAKACPLLAAIVLILGFSAAGNATALPKLSISDVSVSEVSCTSQVAVFSVSVSAPFGKDATVQYATADGSAIAGTDYTAVSGTLSFPRGSKASQTITVPIADVLIPGPNKTFYVNLSNAVNATLTKSQATGTIQAPSVAKCQSCGLSCDDGDVCTSDICSATLGCLHVNRSAIAEPYCQLAGRGVFITPDPNFGHCGPINGGGTGEWADSDGDGLSDAAEKQGYIDVNGNGVYDSGIDVSLPGANPNQPDVYLHYDYMTATDHDHNPPAQAIQWMIDAFAARGITLHIDPVHNAIPEAGQKVVTNQTTGPPDFSINPACAGDTSTGGAVSMHALAQQYLPGNMKLAYHYMVFAHFSTCPDAAHCSACATGSEGACVSGSATSPPPAGAVGDAEVGGSHAIVALGAFVDAATPIPLETSSGVTMHELGHNFGLVHGGITTSGADCANQKPNYISVMNYSFTTAGIPVAAAPGDVSPKSCATDSDCVAPTHCSGPTGSIPNSCVRIDYSSVLLPNLNENSLDETVGLNVSSASTDLSVFYTNGGTTTVFAPTNGSPIDWNQDGGIETNACADISGTSPAACGSLPTLQGANDWATTSAQTFANLNFAFQCTTNFQQDTAAANRPPGFDRLLQRYWLAARSQPAGSWVSKTVVLVEGPSTRASARSAPVVDWLKERSLWPRP